MVFPCEYVAQQIWWKRFILERRVTGASELKHEGEIRADRQRETGRQREMETHGS